MRNDFGTLREVATDAAPLRLAYLTSHPIQYQAPLFRELSRSRGVALRVFFFHDHGLAPSFDRGFGQTVKYDTPLIGGYQHELLRNHARSPSISFTGMVNPAVASIVRSGEFDAVVVHGYASVSSLLALLSPGRGHTQVLLRGESHLMDPRAPWKLAVKQGVLRALFTRIDHFLAIGTLNREYYEHYGVARERITVAPYAIDNDFFSVTGPRAEASASARAALGLPAGHPLFLFCGKLIDAKRPLDALRAFARARTDAECGLVVAGTGPLAERLAQEARALGVAGDVHFLGFRNQTELPRVYAACDALVLPSEREPWGLVVNEAMSSGMAIATSRGVGSAPDLVSAKNGATFPVGDVESLAGILRGWARSRSVLTALGAASRGRIAAWGIPQAADGILEGVRRAVATGGAR